MSQIIKLLPVSWKDTNVLGGLWGRRQQINHFVTIPSQYKRFEERGSFEALKRNWKAGDPNAPHPFWDSDFGKWIEAAAFSLAKYPDPELEKLVDSVIDEIAENQQSDGYFNTYFDLIEPDKKWTNLYYMHELYCAGHLAEGAVAYYLATGKRKFLDVMCRYMDHIDARFGSEPGKIHGYCGHQEIELALVKLYRATGEERYLKLSKYFIDERGKQPYFFELESLQRGVDTEKTANQQRHLKYYLKEHGPYAEYQSHLPVREQEAPVGHAVRAMYMYSAMADLAADTQDKSLLDASEKLWDRLTQRQMYITGGIGPSSDGERFTFDYDLPNEYTYNETCASIGLVMWAHRMLQFNADRKYADVMEQTLYNTVLSGVSVNGDEYSYANYLAVYPDRFKYASTLIIDKMMPGRHKWFNVACCPPNVARLIASIGQYMYSTSEDGIYVHLYNDSETTVDVKGNRVTLTQQTNYPWEGHIGLTIMPETAAEFTVAVRYPGWCSHAEIKVNGNKVDAPIVNGYFMLNRNWAQGDVVELLLDMPIQLVESHPSVRTNSGKVALQRGPLVYCMEETDNARDLSDLSLVDETDIKVQYEADLLDGVVTLELKGQRRETSSWEGQLYRPVQTQKTDVLVKAIPYFLWANRDPGEMLIWINHNCSCGSH
ncbi:MAG: glycoside hydrolase family 127 protein [Candidatus Cohnella colombiensis]|uniref:Glycoside hydrolase family 127 protein n=1 Tax=Candidatus Cohnella colombiensis TaxID=3121368 RepID=A0AA95EXR4_9BACL|nr:MAG: glycoside hydrolase family 127 protein [Cohnella sp.]